MVLALLKYFKNRLLFGDASSATLISNQGIAKIGEFDLGTDGSGYDNIIVRNGANRHREKTGESYIDKNGNKHYDDCFFMDGEAVFNFTIDRLPQLIDSCLVKNKMNSLLQCPGTMSKIGKTRNLFTYFLNFFICSFFNTKNTLYQGIAN